MEEAELKMTRRKGSDVGQSKRRLKYPAECVHRRSRQDSACFILSQVSERIRDDCGRGSVCCFVLTISPEFS